MQDHNNYMSGKSTITISKEHLQELVNKKAGTGEAITKDKERVDFGETIGTYVDIATGEKSPTTVGIIHYSKKGVHVVPAKPKEK